MPMNLFVRYRTITAAQKCILQSLTIQDCTDSQSHQFSRLLPLQKRGFSLENWGLGRRSASELQNCDERGSPTSKTVCAAAQEYPVQASVRTYPLTAQSFIEEYLKFYSYCTLKAYVHELLLGYGWSCSYFVQKYRIIYCFSCQARRTSTRFIYNNTKSEIFHHYTLLSRTISKSNVHVDHCM